MKRIVSYFQQVRTELTKVSWPNRKEVVKLTIIVVVISAVVAGYVGGLDFLFTKLLSSALAR